MYVCIYSNFIDIFISSCHVFIHSSNAENWVWYIGGRHLLYQSFFDTKLLMNKNEDTLHSTNNVGLTPFFIQFAKEKAKGKSHLSSNVVPLYSNHFLWLFVSTYLRGPSLMCPSSFGYLQILNLKSKTIIYMYSFFLHDR